MSSVHWSTTDHAVVKGAVLREMSAAGRPADSTNIASYLPYPESTGWSALYALWKAGQVERQRVGRTSYWRRIK